MWMLPKHIFSLFGLETPHIKDILNFSVEKRSPVFSTLLQRSRLGAPFTTNSKPFIPLMLVLNSTISCHFWNKTVHIQKITFLSWKTSQPFYKVRLISYYSRHGFTDFNTEISKVWDQSESITADQICNTYFSHSAWFKDISAKNNAEFKNIINPCLVYNQSCR